MAERKDFPEELPEEISPEELADRASRTTQVLEDEIVLSEGCSHGSFLAG